ncbi:hypothetical protein A3G67_04530 [Candidatus Roizmanbacteria bacterium RIFCSPLOWO2_12_FULL_40_12]|uniref:Endonuclease/exonuclease/phosphatase domain-containing protein n=1 Tax=Candidatus Roizmanbacteria bacterium RIFCSPLOWO2_01_FULL_40_42 TaxID=1802066 RepID=A0A1F7J4Q9_9BACT|nr:MAG: hypothetical protein A2779_04620 [Candidatus Roizmanbacteria bacterium RIFCSPHIGHO2_01_FULL_40_98]OGK27358.1 MAG: hypothetical protein A3C31_04945 [Candidatus Roizmanbacteria bacterium RIFCSPHIGHO2_02_FULL_40_53]OGK30770.1 MAG: hypothetical protein A2W49_02095 [Candidatus Roizmanbacteria bacterium RIFCSPHIGHO2_12_41_18]OGK36463.1 MAG: hypothetical protein A3E69_02570 [Candidatus Roizmanbacteria bacterium RIFCSPHIGHO2_12_FULL_40_130]OGK50591.1 MAG: hypothetical protein A3B50_02300 [Candi
MKIKFLTLNTLHGGELFDEMLAFLKKEDADIMALQEVQESDTDNPNKKFHTTEILKKELAYPFSVFDSQVNLIMQGVKTEHGNAVYSKFPITSHSNTFFDVPYGHVNHDELLAKDDFTRIPQAFQKIEIKVNNMELTIINVHGIWGFDGEDNERRLKMSQMIVDKIKGEKNVILAGDFNVRPETETIRNIEKYLKNVFKDELKSTFNMKRKKDGGYATSVVDMIFVSPDIKVTNHYCPDVDVSDHLPLVCELEI